VGPCQRRAAGGAPVPRRPGLSRRPLARAVPSRAVLLRACSRLRVVGAGGAQCVLSKCNAVPAELEPRPRAASAPRGRCRHHAPSRCVAESQPQLAARDADGHLSARRAAPALAKQDLPTRPASGPAPARKGGRAPEAARGARRGAGAGRAGTSMPRTMAGVRARPREAKTGRSAISTRCVPSGTAPSPAAPPARSAASSCTTREAATPCPPTEAPATTSPVSRSSPLPGDTPADSAAHCPECPASRHPGAARAESARGRGRTQLAMETGLPRSTMALTVALSRPSAAP
jgi:hypothetical protein